MWMVWTRVERPPARPWPGRRGLAVLDALAWPAVAMTVIVQWAALAGGTTGPIDGGVVVRLGLALCVLVAIRRAWRALADNTHYHFTTWRWARPAAVLLLLGLALKLASGWSPGG